MEKKFKYPALVRQEAKNLRKLITATERDRLYFGMLNPKNEFACIYGQMTGSCFSMRAEELIVKSCARVYKFDKQAQDDFLSTTLNGKPQLGGRYKNEKFVTCNEPEKMESDVFKTIPLTKTFWSPIEVFIYKEKNQKSGANKRLLSYIKREIKTL